MNTVLIGNAVALLGAAIMVSTGFLKTKKQILTVQCAQFCVLGTSNLILGGFTGVTSAVVSLMRNLICLKRTFTLPLKLAFIVLQAALALAFNREGLLGVLPALSTVIYTWFLDAENETTLKLSIIAAQLCWVMYDLSLQNYVSFAFDIGTVVSTAIGILMLRRSRR